MHSHITLASKCLHLALVSSLATARLVPYFHPQPTTSDENHQFGPAQFPQQEANLDHQFFPDAQFQQENNFNWQFATDNTKQINNVENLVKQSLENIFHNQELTNHGDFGLKTPVKEETPLGDTAGDYDGVDLSSPHILKVPVPQPYPVHIPVKQPFKVPIFKLVPEEVEKMVPIPVQKLVPVYKEKPVKVIVEKHHPVHVLKPYAVPVPVHTHVLIGRKKEQSKWQ